MKVLAIDCSGLVASASVVNEEKLLCEFTINNKLTHAQTIMPIISESLRLAEIDKSEIDYVAVSSGPGSFTGLRIGAATAKSIAHGLGKRLIPVPTLDSLAYNIFITNHIIVPIMDARKNQVYTALYKWINNDLEKLTDYMALSLQELFAMLKEYKEEIIFLGDAVLVYESEIKQLNYKIVPINNNVQRAASIAALAIKNINLAINYDEFTPYYLRSPQVDTNFA